MYRPRNLTHAVLQALPQHGITQLDLAKRMKVEPSTVTRLIAGRRPSEEILVALCNAWKDHKTELALLCEHLRDEIERAGKLTKDIQIEASGTGRKADDVDRIMARLEIAARHDDDLRRLLADIAAMLDAHDRRQLPLAAEPSGTYTAGKTSHSHPRKNSQK